MFLKECGGLRCPSSASAWEHLCLRRRPDSQKQCGHALPPGAALSVAGRRVPELGALQLHLEEGMTGVGGGGAGGNRMESRAN